jgi:hypothetical protein
MELTDALAKRLADAVLENHNEYRGEGQCKCHRCLIARDLLLALRNKARDEQRDTATFD